MRGNRLVWQRIRTPFRLWRVRVVRPSQRRESIGIETLSRIVERWKPVLGLEDWSIRVELVDFAREWQSGDVKVDDVEKSALVLMSRHPFRNEERVLVHELVHVMLWPLDQAAMDLAGTAPPGSRERELAEALVFRALEPVTEQVTAALFRASGRKLDSTWAALEEEARPRIKALPSGAAWGLGSGDGADAQRDAGVPDGEARVGIEEVWARIEAATGQTFRQIRGGEFTYEVKGNSLVPDRTNRVLSRSDFERALEFVPLKSTVPVQHLQGPSYLYAILMDSRIRQSDW